MIWTTDVGASSFVQTQSGCWLCSMKLWTTPLHWLGEVPGYWKELKHTVAHARPGHLHTVLHVEWVRYLATTQAMQELGCSQLPGIVYITHCNMRQRWLRSGTTMDLRICVCVCVSFVFTKKSYIFYWTKNWSKDKSVAFTDLFNLV